MNELISLLPLLLPLLCLVVVLIRIQLTLIKNEKLYKETAYYHVTRNEYSTITQDKGKHGEYLIYKNLQPLEESGGKFLFNLYIPKFGDKTTEIDILLICSKGIFVFESKNYSGWIFGNEANKNWTQTLPSGWRGDCHKERFYNPIMQNATHIKYLRYLVGGNIPIKSVIVFSDLSTLKDITIKNSNVNVINCENVLPIVNQICNQIQNDILTQFEIYNIYNKLYPYTQVTSQIILAHQNNLQNF